MKKKSVAKLFFKSLLKSLLCIVAILAVGFASYKISYTVLLDKKNNIDTDAENLKDIMREAQTDEVSKNLIYVKNEKGKISHVMLEICNTKTYNMDYLTIPAKTDYTIPSGMYRKLCQVNPEIPQVIRVSDMLSYFKEEKDACGYGVLIFEKMLGVDISYYTEITQETYDSHYVEQSVKVEFKTTGTEGSTASPDGTIPKSNVTITTQMDISVLSDAYKQQIADLGNDEEKIAEYIKEQYERVESNLTVYNKIGYLEAYEKMDVTKYHFWGIPCKKEGKIYIVDTKAAKQAIKKLVSNDKTYTDVQNVTGINKIGASVAKEASTEGTNAEVASSKGLKIRVLNGSQISGLASSTKQRLEAAGYTVPAVGNYTAETLTTTRIIVRKSGQGEDLKAYFTNPELAVGGVAEGFDIEIVLGTIDANR